MLPFMDKNDFKAMLKNSASKSDTVIPIAGEPLRFHVVSRTIDGLLYLVDLEEHERNGACGCPDFEFRHRPKFNDGAKPNGGDERRCWHIVQARNYFLDAAVRVIARNFYEKKR
jgi:hypothetical protein